MKKWHQIAREIVMEYFGGYLPNSLAEEGMECYTNEEIYSLVEKIEIYYMGEHPEADFEGNEDIVHGYVTKIVQELNLGV